MRKYELMMIVNPALSETERSELLSVIESEITDAGAQILERRHPGEQKLAYRIRSSDTGYYLLYTIESEGKGGFFGVSDSFNIKKDVWRYMFTKIGE